MTLQEFIKKYHVYQRTDHEHHAIEISLHMESSRLIYEGVGGDERLVVATIKDSLASLLDLLARAEADLQLVQT